MYCLIILLVHNNTSASLNFRFRLVHCFLMRISWRRWAKFWSTIHANCRAWILLAQGAFVDALALRYGWPPTRTPMTCVCGSNFTVEHVLSCPRGGFPSIRHNEIRDLTATLLTEVCNEVTVEPTLQEVTDERMMMRSAITTEDYNYSLIWY